ncbi:MAG TPA: lytic transglycosylase, partial [Rhodocyclaceae bacterium]|nr:lytic transglycosylase [Rhodocyclaceae bacterium]
MRVGIVLLSLGLALPPAAMAGAPTGKVGTQFIALREEAKAYEHGEGVPRDGARAAELYCE